MSNSDFDEDYENQTTGVVSTLIGRVLEGAVSLHDDGSRPGMFDYRIELADGTQVALEITSIVGADSIRFATAADRHSDATGLRSLWMLEPSHTGTDPKALFRSGREHLIAMEAAGVTEFDARNPDDEWGRLMFDQHRIRSGQSYDADEGGVLFGSHWVGSVGFDEGLEAAEVEANREDNIRKLRAAVADERHIAVAVEVGSGRPHLAINAQGWLPERPPSVDDCVDNFWIAQMWESERLKSVRVLWRWSRIGGWSNVAV